MLSPGHIRVAKHPEHGEPVVYVPGELLPEYVADALANGAMLRPVPDMPGVFDLVRADRPVPRSAKPAEKSRR